MRQNMAGKFGHIKWRIRVFGHNWMTAWCRRDSYLSERLSHLTQEVLGQLDGFVHRQVQTAVTDVLLNPARKLPPFVCSGVTLWAGHTRWSHEHTPTGHKGLLFYGETQDWVITHLVSKNHESVVCLSSDGSANTLGSVAHGIKRQKVILSDLKVIPQVLQASLKRASEGKTSVSAEQWRSKSPEDLCWGCRLCCCWQQFWPSGCDSACKHKELQTWWLLGQNGALNRNTNMIQS